ncbi:hypothetical protein Pint_11888 [Pistacia integerrima]|uniref:Uncharacterized protein n=1 Tax=Pistacia integerrima TaxID=434235 RepID=A0ACC0XDW5_9ROSI|nr:hypothetical protein Pint_11888 [Pistacia integerrima]
MEKEFIQKMSFSAGDPRSGTGHAYIDPCENSTHEPIPVSFATH